MTEGRASDVQIFNIDFDEYTTNTFLLGAACLAATQIASLPPRAQVDPQTRADQSVGLSFKWVGLSCEPGWGGLLP